MNQNVLLALIIALGVVYVLKGALPRILVRQAARHAFSEVGRRALTRVPGEVKLSRVDSPQWKNEAAVEQQAAPLRREGFDDLGAYVVDTTPAVLIRMMYQSQTYVAAHIYDHPSSGSWTEFATRYTDGSSHTLSTLPPTGIDPPEWVRKIQADKSTPTDQLYRQFLTQREWHGIKQVAAEDAVREFEENYKKLMVWRQERGITPHEVAHVALKWAKKKGAGTIG